MKSKQLYIININLILWGILSIVSSIILEGLGGDQLLGLGFNYWVIFHLIIVIPLTVFIYYHLVLHFGGINNWYDRLKKIKSAQTKWLTWLYIITFITGIITTVQFLKGEGHTGFGGVHGKFGFAAVILMIFHFFKRKHYYKRRKSI